MLTVGEFLKLARAQVGKPYRLGAEASPRDDDPEAFDCSELVEWLYAKAGVTIPDLAATQFDATEPVEPGSEHVGDLVFLRNNAARWNGIGHVAMLGARLTNGDFEVIEAKGRAYGVVRTTLSFWRTRNGYTGVRRFAGFKLAAPAKGVVKPVALKLDGVLGPKTITALQRRIGAPASGEFDDRTERALQMWLGVKADGIVTALQRRVGARVTTRWDRPTTLALQVWLNAQAGVK